MSTPANRNGFIDGRTGEAVAYTDMLAQFGPVNADFFPQSRPESTREAVSQIVEAIAFERDRVLFDPDGGEEEIATLRLFPTELIQPASLSCAGSFTMERLSRLAAGESRARLGLFTSGSTGLPKLVWQSVANLARAVRVSPARSEAVWALAYRPTHVAGVQVLLQALANGCSVVDVGELGREEIFSALERHCVTHLSATPSFYRLLLPADRVLPAVRSVTLGGESADAQLMEKLAALFPHARMHNVYASTEAGTLLVADGEVFAIAPGLEGRVEVWENTLRVHRSLLGQFAGTEPVGEWYDTGDAVEITSEAPLRFRIVARQRDWINVGGNKLNPREVEAVLEQHPAVARARVFGRKNSVLGQVLCAEVIVRGPVPAEADLREFAGAQLQPFKVPRIIRCVDQIAATRTGKTMRT